MLIVLCCIRRGGALVNGRAGGGWYGVDVWQCKYYVYIYYMYTYSCRSTAAAVDDGVERSVVIYHSP